MVELWRLIHGGGIMKGQLLALSLLVLSSIPVGDASRLVLGVGGPSDNPTKVTEPTEPDIFDVDTVSKIIALEMSVEEAMKELTNVRTVEIVRPDIWPVVGVITSDYGWRTMAGRKEFHTGIDISAPYGTPVVASSEGRVIYAGWIRGYGKTVIIYHGYGFATLYSHLSEIKVSYSDRVIKGQIIGNVGTTGRAFGPHLHYEVLKYGVRQNPIAYLP
ncbi:MAG: M23 family metallopeptidase [Aquificaceae bacterium]|nr:M23 family metallopeptidase [Aquificaceae bacterium]MDW8423088.1 M23 family metallopeptidase [Aquificaceae bacterium]